MADNVSIQTGNGATIATDEVGGVQFQRIKVTFGADGVANDVTSANPLPVTVTDGSGALTVDGTVAATQSGTWAATANAPTVSTVTVTQVNGSASSVQLLASNTSRKGATIVNDSSAILYVKLGTTASTSSYSYKLAAGDTLELPTSPLYTGKVDGIWASATGVAAITEF